MTIAAPTTTPSHSATLAAVGTRDVLKLARSPQTVGIAVVQSLMFLVMFRYVIGGAMSVDGLDYVQFLVPGFIVSGLLFTAGGSAVGTAEDAAAGLFDRFRSLPIPDSGVLTARTATDTTLMVAVGLSTLAAAIAMGFRITTPTGHVFAAVALFVLYAFAFAWIFTWIGLSAGSAQAAQGLGILGVPFSFVSSAYVPIDSMPPVLNVVAEYQPLTYMVNAWRGLLVGDDAIVTLDHDLAHYVTGSIIWSIAIIAVAAPLTRCAYRHR